MRRLRRATALLVNLLFVQLLLVGTGTLCVGGGHGSMDDGARGGAMSTDRMMSGQTAGESGERPSECGATSDRAPCGAPAVPGGDCVQMSSCAAPMIAELPVAPVASLGGARAVALPATAPFGAAPAPDVPPPRA